MQSPPSSIIFSIGGFHLHYYGLIMFFAILCAILTMRFVAKKFYKDVDTSVLLDILPPILLCAILGARIYYVALDFSYYSKHAGEIFAVWNGGISIHGALIGGILCGVWLARKNKFSFLKYADIFAYGLLIGQAVGRLGNYFNCEAFGKPTLLPWGLYIPEVHRPFEYYQYSYFHPTFLYEIIWNLLVFTMLILLTKKRTYPAGTVFFGYLVLYSIGRFFIEFLRIDSVLNVGIVPVAQIVCVIAAVIGILGVIRVNRKK